MIKLVENKGFVKNEEDMIEDIYMRKNKEYKTVEDLLNNCILIRTVGDKYSGFTLKRKKYDIDGSIKENLKQNLEVKDIENGKEFLENIGYVEYFRLNQRMYCYNKNTVSFSIFDVKNLGVFLEYESKYGESASEIKKILDSIFEQSFSNYYEKKAILYIKKYHLF